MAWIGKQKILELMNKVVVFIVLSTLNLCSSANEFTTLENVKIKELDKVISVMEEHGVTDLSPTILGDELCDTISIIDSSEYDCWSSYLYNCTTIKKSIKRINIKGLGQFRTKSHIAILSDYSQKIMYIYNKSKNDMIIYQNCPKRFGLVKTVLES